MMCPKCQSENVTVQEQTNIKTKHRGCLGWCLWLMLAFCTFGLILIIPLLTNSKTKTKHKKICICQSCGHSWDLK